MSIDWAPNSTWWDIETILAQDTRDYKYKSIYLLNDSQPIFRTYGDTFATSDGRFYPQGGEHTWNTNEDKPCIIDGEVAYSTRFVIVYSDLPRQSIPKGDGLDMNSIIGCIVDGVLGLGAFGGQCALEYVKIKPYLTSIVNGAFINCYNLQSVDLPAGLERIEPSAFAGCRNLRRIELPSTLNFLGAQAFYDCESLESISLPEGIKDIGRETFALCSHLVSISMPQVETIGDLAFNGCQSLRTAFVPNVQTIGSSAFSDCHSLCSLVIGGNPVVVESNNGYACHSLRSLVLPENVVLKQYAFSQMTQLQHVTFKGNCSMAGIGFNGSMNLSNITLPQDFDSSANFSHATLAPEMMVEMFDKLKDNSPKTLTLGATNLLKLTDEQKAIATDKNWILA